MRNPRVFMRLGSMFAKCIFFVKVLLFVLSSLAISLIKHNKIPNLKELEYLTAWYLTNGIFKKLDASSFNFLLLKLYKKSSTVVRNEDRLNKLKIRLLILRYNNDSNNIYQLN